MFLLHLKVKYILCVHFCNKTFTTYGITNLNKLYNKNSYTLVYNVEIDYKFENYQMKNKLIYNNYFSANKSNYN